MARKDVGVGAYPLSGVMSSYHRANNARLNTLRANHHGAIDLLEACAQQLRRDVKREHLKLDFTIESKNPAHKEACALVSNGHKKSLEAALDCAFQVSKDGTVISIARNAMVFKMEPIKVSTTRKKKTAAALK